MAPQNSGFFFIGDDESQSFINSHSTSSHGNSSNFVPGCGPTGANINDLSVVSGDRHNGSTYSLSFSLNNITILGSSVANGSNVVQQQDPTNVQVDGSNATSQTQIPLCRAPRALKSFLQVPNNLTQTQRKPRLSNQDDDDLTQLTLSQWLQGQELSQQQAQLHRQQRERLHQQQVQQFSGSRLYENSVCARRLVKYLYYQRRRPSNSIGYWRNFVTEFFSPGAKKRWCLSHPNNLGHITHGLFPLATMVKWECNLCDSNSGRGFEATFDSLPRLQEIKFASGGVLDEIFALKIPSERKYDSGITVLEFKNVVKKTVYEHVCVVREGHLRIIFSPQLKILSWEFCIHRHQKLLRQVNQAADKCQQDLQANSNMVMAAGSQLAKGVESCQLHGLGFSKRYVRGLQTSEIVTSMKDMMEFCCDQKVGPIEALKSYPYRKIAQEKDQVVNASRGLPPDTNNSLNKHMALRNSGTSIAMNNMNGQGSLPASAQATASVLANYQTMLMKQNNPKSDPNNTAIQQDPSTRNQSASQGYQGTGPLLPGFVQTPSISAVSYHLSPQQQMPSSIYNGSTSQYHHQPPSGSCAPAAETPSTSDKGINGLDQSQNMEDMGSGSSLDYEIDIDKLYDLFCDN